jgi:cell division protein FtsQ
MRPTRPSHRISVFAGPILLVAVAIVFLLVLFAMNGPVRVVKVSGDLTAAEQAEVRAAVVAALDGSYFTLDLDALVESVLDLSWPHDVRVRRVFPAGVRVEVAKEVFVARWGGGGVLNSEGEVITTPDADVGALPLLDCALADGGRAMQVYKTLAALLSVRNLRVAALRENHIGEWTVEFESALTVALGSNDVLGRLERFLAVYDGVLVNRLHEVAAVDARYPNGIAVDWRDPGARGAGPVQIAAVDRVLPVSN